MTKHRNPTLIEFGPPRRSLCQPLCRPRVQTRFKQGSDKVQTRLLTRFRQGENLSKQGSTRLDKVEFFPVAPKSDEGGSQSLLTHSTFPLPAYGCKANYDTSESQRDWNHSAHGLRACELPWDNRRAQINSERVESDINLRIESLGNHKGATRPSIKLCQNLN